MKSKFQGQPFQDGMNQRFFEWTIFRIVSSLGTRFFHQKWHKLKKTSSRSPSLFSCPRENSWLFTVYIFRPCSSCLMSFIVGPWSNQNHFCGLCQRPNQMTRQIYEWPIRVFYCVRQDVRKIQIIFSINQLLNRLTTTSSHNVFISLSMYQISMMKISDYNRWRQIWIRPIGVRASVQSVRRHSFLKLKTTVHLGRTFWAFQ